MKRILVINLAFIGDVLLSSPVTRALKEAYPEAELDMVTIPVVTPAAERNPYVDSVFTYDKRGRHRKLGELFRLIRSLRNRRYDLAISMNFSLRSSLVAWASGAKRRIGYDSQGGGILLTDRLSPDRTRVRHETENHLEVLIPLGIRPSTTDLAWVVRGEDRKTMRLKTSQPDDRPLVVLCPVGSYPAKSLPNGHYTRIVKELSANYRVALIGGVREAEEIVKINESAGGVAEVYAGNLTLPELAALLESASVMLSVDTGPMHMAQAVGTPVIGLFGPTDPRIWGPRGSHDRVFFQDESCSPCWGRNECENNRCLSEMEPEAIIAAVRMKIECGGNQEETGCR